MRLPFVAPPDRSDALRALDALLSQDEESLGSEGSLRALDLLQVCQRTGFHADARLSTGEHSGLPMLIRAAELGWTDVVKALLAAGAFPDAATSLWKNTALHNARTSAVAQALIDGGATVDVLNDRGFSPLLHHILNIEHRGGPAQLPLIQVLVKAGADVQLRNLSRQPLLHAAILMGDVSVVTELLLHGADWRACDALGHDALSIARANQLKKTSGPEIVRALRAFHHAQGLAKTLASPVAQAGSGRRRF